MEFSSVNLVGVPKAEEFSNNKEEIFAVV